MTWGSYVASLGSQIEVAKAAGVTPSAVSRWDESTPKPEVAARVARHFGRPVLEAFIVAGYLTSEEAGELPSGPIDLNQLGDDELLGEVRRRMKEGRNEGRTPDQKKTVGGSPIQGLEVIPDDPDPLGE